MGFLLERIRNAQCFWFWNLQEPTHFWYHIQCLTDRARRLQDSTTSQLPSPFSTWNIPSHQSLPKAPWKVLCAGQLEGGFQSILLPCREISLGMGLKKGGGAVKQDRNNPAALPWPAKNKSFPCPTNPCLGQVGIYGGRRTDRPYRGHWYSHCSAAKICITCNKRPRKEPTQTM